MMRGGESSALCGCRKSMTASLEISNCELCPQDQSRPLLGLSIISLRMVCASLSESATATKVQSSTNPVASLFFPQAITISSML